MHYFFIDLVSRSRSFNHVIVVILFGDKYIIAFGKASIEIFDNSTCLFFLDAYQIVEVIVNSIIYFFVPNNGT
jgi:hypothetical protein